MYHTLEATAEFTVDLETSPKNPLERVRIERGLRIRAQLKPYVIDTDDGPVEVADLFLEDGSAVRRVPFAHFCFAE